MKKSLRSATSGVSGMWRIAPALLAIGVCACTPGGPADGGSLADAAGSLDAASATDSATGGEAAVVADASSSAVLNAAFLAGTWVSGCDVIGETSARYCTTFSGVDGFATRTMFFSASVTCSGASNIIPGSGTYALAGAASSPADATNVNLVLDGFGSRFSILGRDGDALRFGKEDPMHNGSSPAQRYVRFMAESHTKSACPF
ncbi:MAG: hypothetical protein Q8Q09_18610 [Deltaproteobacteria bacterium]|nr:hypothetical protein [Deltaproteobacteria bacterium]